MLIYRLYGVSVRASAAGDQSSIPGEAIPYMVVMAVLLGTPEQQQHVLKEMQLPPTDICIIIISSKN